MEGKLSMEDDDSSSSPTRRRVLKASAALTATGIVGGSGFVGQAAANHRTDISCSDSKQSSAAVVFSDQTVGDCIRGTCGPDSVYIDRIELTCPNGGWVDLHDQTTRTGPSGTFKAGYPVGASTLFAQGTYTNVEIPLLDCPPAPNGSACLEWNRCNWPNDQNPSASRSMSAMLHLEDPDDGKITHYCEHGDGVKGAPDPAYLDHSKQGSPPVQAFAEITGDGDDCGTCSTV